jgi:hypothetical protein
MLMWDDEETPVAPQPLIPSPSPVGCTVQSSDRTGACAHTDFG